MTAQIRPARMEISDRFPELGFVIRSGQPIEAEVALASDPALFQPENRSKRTAANFYSSREHGLLQLNGGDSAYVVPAQVLARFIGTDRLYFALVHRRARTEGLPVQVEPTGRDSRPFVSLHGLTRV